MEIAFKTEIELNGAERKALSGLLQKCFTDTPYQGRSYFKQLPGYRLIATSGKKLLGQVGIDFRVMNLDGKPIRVLGAIDLCVDPRHRNQGIGTALMREFEKLARKRGNNVDFLFLVTDVPGFYAGLGYKPTKPTVTWLKLHLHKSIGIGAERPANIFLMFKPMGRKKWAGRVLDMLGYWY